MFKRRLKKRCLPDWLGVAPNCSDTPVEPVCSVNVQNPGTEVAVDKKNDVKNDSSQIEQIPENAVNTLQEVCCKTGDKYLGQNEKETKTVTKKRKPGVDFLATSSSSARETKSRLFDEQVAQSLPLLEYSGVIIYSYNTNDCCLLCEELLTKLDSSTEQGVFVGFDMEWPVFYQKGHGSGKVALIQVTFSEEKCYLFHLAAMGTFPKRLKLLLQDNRLKKVGVNIVSDWWKLERDFDGMQAMSTIANSVIDLSKLANDKLKTNENWSLEGLCRHVLKMRISKTDDVRCGRWDTYPLTEQQQRYAALDAHVCLKIFNSLQHCNKS